MYLARKTIKGTTRYFIRESFREGDHLIGRDLLDLGTNPAKHIIYPGGNAFYIDQVIEERLHSMGVEPTPDELDEVFRAFLRPEIRRKLEPYLSRSQRTRKDKEETAGLRVHMFDKRRIHYLKYGQIDQGTIGRISPKLFRNLTNKSRDEIEQYFLEKEMRLDTVESKTYVYVIFDLQRFFKEMIAKIMPQGLSQDKVDENFLNEICRLNRDRSFWAGMSIGDKLHDYLIRYVIMFFDHEYTRSPFLDEFVQNFINSRRHQRRYPQKTGMSLDEASTIFGVTKDALKKMSRRGLTRIYRRMAQTLHPDKGGDQDRFVKLTAAYQKLLRKK